LHCGPAALFRLAPTGAAIALALLGQSSSASPQLVQNIKIGVEEGFTIFSIGNLTFIDNMAVNDDGRWVVEAKTDNTNKAQDTVILRGDFQGSQPVLVLLEGVTLPDPPLATVSAFGDINLNSTGFQAWKLDLGNAGTTDIGVFFNLNLLILENDVTLSTSWPANTIWKTFTGARINNSNQIGVIGQVNDPTTTATLEPALHLLLLDASGELSQEITACRVGATIPGLPVTETVKLFSTAYANWAFNEKGDFFFYASINATSNDEVLLVYHSATNSLEVVARQNDLSPVPLRFYDALVSPELDMNDDGDLLFLVQISGDDASDNLLVLNDTKIVQEGDSLPDISPYKLTSFGSGSVDLSNGGSVVHYGDWDNPGLDFDTGFFRDTRLIIQEGVSTVEDGLVLDNLRGQAAGYAVSPNGRYMVFEGVKTNGLEGVYLIDFGSIDPIESCTPNLASLRRSAGLPALGQQVTMELDDAQADGSLPIFWISESNYYGIMGDPDCGLAVPYGEFIASLTSPDPVVVSSAAPWMSGTPSQIPQFIPNDPTLLNRVFYAQGIFFKPGGATVTDRLRLTNAVEVQIGEG
jgi:hypothetical protein